MALRAFPILLVLPATPADTMESPRIFFPGDAIRSDRLAGCATVSTTKFYEQRSHWI